MSDPSNDISAEELEFRKSEYPDDEEVLKKKTIECTICKTDLRKAIVKNFELTIHPALQVLICDDCEEFYGDGEFSVDEDGSDKYCRWCGQGGNLYCCSDCSGALCSKCVKKNLPKAYKKEIERDDWRCFKCDPKPLWSYRAIAAAAKSFLDNRETSKPSKRTRKAVSENDSDEEVFVKRTKKSRRDSPSDDSRNETEDKHWKKPKSAEGKNENRLKPFCISLPKTKIFESDEESSSTSVVKKEDQNDSDSEESSAPSSAKRKSLRVGKLKVAFPPRKNPPRKRQESDDSDESSSTSPVKKSGTRGSRRNLDSEDSLPATSTGKTTGNSRRSRRENLDSEDSLSTGNATRKSRRSRRENLDSEDRVPTTPSKKKASKGSDERPEKEKNLLFLLLKDTSKDLDKFSKVVASNTKQFEEKFLKKREFLDQKKLSAAKDKLHKLLQDTTESIMALQNSYSNALKTLDNDGQVVDRDGVEREIVDAVNGHRTDDDETKKLLTKKDLVDESVLGNSTVENSDMEVIVESVDAPEDAVDSSQKEGNIVKKKSKNDELDQDTLDDSKELPQENTVNESTTDTSLVVQPSLSSPEVSIADSLPSTSDDPENSTTTAKLTNQKEDNQSVIKVDVEQEPMDESCDVDDDNLKKSKTTDPSRQDCDSKHNGRANENPDSSTLTDTEENEKDENQSKVSKANLLESNMDKVKSV